MFRVGIGYDVHKFSSDRKLIVGGVEVPCEFGLLGHSDADVLVHAIMDSMLGALALGDIGFHFPDNDPQFKGISSLQLLTLVNEKIKERGYSIGNIDSIIVAQVPKFLKFIPQMRENISQCLGIDIDKVSVKATTEEGLGFTGKKEGIAAKAVCILLKN